MRIISLEPFITELVCHFGLEESLVAVSHLCDYPESVTKLPKITASPEGKKRSGSPAQFLSQYPVEKAELLKLEPSLVLTCVADEDPKKPKAWRVLNPQNFGLGTEVRVVSYNPKSLEDVYEVFEKLAKELGVHALGIKLASRMKAQFMDWGDNFYERMKNKKVSFICAVEPLVLAGRWVPDLIGLCSAHSQIRLSGAPDQEIKWKELLEFKPDVIVVAPKNCDALESARTFSYFAGLPEWEELPAVKRGEVYFSDGKRLFSRAGPGLLDSMGVLVSAVAGLESGYITERESFHKLRFLELHRHKFTKKES